MALGEDCARKEGTGIALKVVLGACESGQVGLCSVTSHHLNAKHNSHTDGQPVTVPGDPRCWDGTGGG